MELLSLRGKRMFRPVQYNINNKYQ